MANSRNLPKHMKTWDALFSKESLYKDQNIGRQVFKVSEGDSPINIYSYYMGRHAMQENLLNFS